MYEYPDCIATLVCLSIVDLRNYKTSERVDAVGKWVLPSAAAAKVHEAPITPKIWRNTDSLPALPATPRKPHRRGLSQLMHVGHGSVGHNTNPPLRLWRLIRTGPYLCLRVALTPRPRATDAILSQ